MKMEIHPAPLVQKYSDLLLQISALESLNPHFDIDIVNWGRTQMQTISVDEALQANTKCNLTFDLMLDYPEVEVKKLVLEKRVQAIILNIDAQENLHDLIDLVHFHKKQVGISINPDTHFYQIVPFIAELDIIQIFTVEPGAQGNPFLEKRLKLIASLRQFGYTEKISVDGGVNLSNLLKIAKLGVDICSVGSAISKSDNPAQAYTLMLNKLQSLD